jgi:hypothetical protein
MQLFSAHYDLINRCISGLSVELAGMEVQRERELAKISAYFQRLESRVWVEKRLCLTSNDSILSAQQKSNPEPQANILFV